MTLTDDEAGKLFVGGLSWETTQDKLRFYFSRYGEVVDSVVMMNPTTGRSRGFGFITFKDADVVSIVLAQGSHSLDGKVIDPKSCTPRSQRKAKEDPIPKIFLGGLPANVTESDVREAFSQFGKVHEVNIMYDQEKRRTRGFGFLSFESSESTHQACSQHYVDIDGKQVECKLAVPRDNAGRRAGYGGQQQPQYQPNNSYEGQQSNWSSGGPPSNAASAPAYATSWGSMPPPQQQNYSSDGNYQGYNQPPPSASYGGGGGGNYSASQPAYPAYGSSASQAPSAAPASGGYNNAHSSGSYSSPPSGAYNSTTSGGYGAGGSGNYGASSASSYNTNASSASSTAGLGTYSQGSSQFSPVKAYSGSSDSPSFQGGYGNGQGQDYRADNSGGGYGSSSQPSRSYGQPQQQSYHPYRR